MNGGVVDIEANNVTLGGLSSGFTIENTSGTTPLNGMEFIGVTVGLTSAVSGTQILGNVIQALVQPSAGFPSGTTFGRVPGIAVTNSTNVTIAGNTIGPISTTAASNATNVYAYGVLFFATNSGPIVSGNTINGLSESGGACPGTGELAISINDNTSNATVSHNDVSAISSTCVASGISTSAASGSVSITNNTVTRVSSSAGQNAGVGLKPNGATVDVSYNDLSYDGAGIAVLTALGSGSAAHFNNLQNNPVGVANLSSTTVDATCNWWGAASGPGPVGPGSGDKVSTGVNFTPWLTAPAPGGACGAPAPVFIQQPTPLPTGTPAPTATPTGGLTGGPSTPPSALPASTTATGSCSIHSGVLFLAPGQPCTVSFAASQGAGTYTISVSGAASLSCPSGASSSTCSGGGGTLTLTATSSGQTLTFVITLSATATSQTRGLLAEVASDLAPSAAGGPAATLNLSGPAGPLSSSVSLSAGISVSVAAGWNLVSGPNGTQPGISGAASSLYTFQASDSNYESFPTSTAISGGVGVWAYFPAATTLVLPVPGSGSLSIALPVGHFIMVGNPTDGTVSLSGADVVDTFNPATNSYTVVTGVTTLAPGQGAWVFSRAGGTLTITST